MIDTVYATGQQDDTNGANVALDGLFNDSDILVQCNKMYGSAFFPTTTVLTSVDDCLCRDGGKQVQCSTLSNEVLSQQCTTIK